MTKRTLSLDDPRKGSIEISNDGMIAASAKTFERMLGRVADLADMVDQRNAIYERAKALSSAGVLPAEKVHGTINMEDNGLDGGTSGWRTDADGGIIFESSLGDSAFKLCGEGFFYADSKTGDNWDWKLYGNGLGFDASALTSGLLDGSMIENGSLSYDKMSTNFDSMLNSSQTIIQYGSILQQAGLSLDENGFLVYAQSSDPDSGYLSAQLSVQAGKIESLLEKTGIDSLGNNETLYGKVTQTAGNLETLYTKTGVNALGQNETLSGKILQTAQSLETVYTKTGINSLGEDETLLSKITQTASDISLVVQNGAISKAAIILAINGTGGSSVEISADNINLEGYVQASQLSTLISNISILNVNSVLGTNMTASGAMRASNVYIQTGTSPVPGGNGQTYATYTSLNDHYHEISVDNDGKITLGALTWTQPDPFDITTTRFFRDAVAAASSGNVTLY